MNNSNLLAGRKVVVTGAAGFIGSHLTEKLLAAGAQVKALVRYNSRSDIGWLSHAIDNKSLSIVSGDVRDPFLVKSLLEGADMVFHLAALIAIPYSYAAPQSYVETNINGTLNILEAARTHGLKKVILTSTSEVYGTALRVPIDEDHPLQAQSPYSASKIAADMMGKAYASSFGLPVVIVRPFNTYGPRQSMRAVIPTIIRQALEGEQIRLGDLRPVRDFNYVGDTAEGFIAAANSNCQQGEIFNLATGRGVSIAETVEIIGQLMLKKIEIQHDDKRQRPADSEVMRLIGNADKAKNLLNWQPQHSLEQGLAETINWVEQNRHNYQQPQKYHY
ncbi:MAG: NAD-dependent dehydratase [Candidatus Riflebacteria bacterium HGW-Riflebacteria-1]|jgi:NAD dependent epimerase/dehydratase|nr:MAG: NAD-dependent dehydratase [Candidatus Riflebacteria bacterium HGW-Riflebacteria-1]